MVKEITQEKTTPLPRPVCIVHTGFPALLAPCRPLRNSRVQPVGIAAGRSRPRAACGASVRPLTPVLEHARFPLQVAPLLGAPQGTPWFLRPGFLPGLRGQPLIQGARQELRAKRKQQAKHVEGHVGPQGLRDIGASSRGPLRGRRDLPVCGLAQAAGFAPVPHPQVLRHKPPRNPGRKPGRRNPGPLGSAEERSWIKGKASMSEHRDVRVAQRP